MSTESLTFHQETAEFELSQRQAKLLASSTLVPKEFQGNMSNCAIGLNIAKRLGADPFMVIQNIDIIHGRPSFRATFLIAMVNAAGRFEPLQFRMDGTEGKPDRSCVAWTKSKADGATLEGPKITLEMAKAEGWSTKNGSKWLTMPELMLRYRAAAFFARLYAPDITLGMMTAEEVADTVERDVTPPSATESKLFKTLATTSSQTSAPPLSVHEDTGAGATLFDVESVSLIDQVQSRLNVSGLKWSDVLTKLQESGIGGEEFTPLELADDDTIKGALSLWAGIVKALGGKEAK